MQTQSVHSAHFGAEFWKGNNSRKFTQSKFVTTKSIVTRRRQQRQAVLIRERGRDGGAKQMD